MLGDTEMHSPGIGDGVHFQWLEIREARIFQDDLGAHDAHSIPRSNAAVVNRMTPPRKFVSGTAGEMTPRRRAHPILRVVPKAQAAVQEIARRAASSRTSWRAPPN